MFSRARSKLMVTFVGAPLGGELLGQVGEKANLRAQQPEELASSLINIALGLIGIIFVLLLVYGGYLWLTARGNEEYVRKAKDTITNALIGIVLVVIAYALSVFIINAVFKAAA